jgi:hypothetical protein
MPSRRSPRRYSAGRAGWYRVLQLFRAHPTFSHQSSRIDTCRQLLRDVDYCNHCPLVASLSTSTSRRQVEWLEMFERENGNLRAAMGWALDEAVETAARLGWALWGFWVLRDHQREGYHLARALLARDIPPPMRPRVVFTACITALTQGDHDAVGKFSAEALESSRKTGDDLCAAYALWAMGVVAMNRGDFAKATLASRSPSPRHRRPPIPLPTQSHDPLPSKAMRLALMPPLD